MKITLALKAFLTQKGWISATTTDAEIAGIVAQKMLDGSVTADEVNKLCKDGNSVADQLVTMVEKAVGAAFAQLNLTPVQTPLPGATPTTTKAIEDAIFNAAMDRLKSTTNFAGAMHGAASDATVVTVKDRYAKGRSELFYPTLTRGGTKHYMAGQPATLNGERLLGTSTMGKAVAQAYLKWTLASTSQPQDIPRGLRMTDHDREILKYALHEEEWSGLISNNNSDDGQGNSIAVKRRKLSGFEIKALLDDATSGGIEIAPIEFDDVLITTPVLFGELLPLVNIVDVSRGRRMKGGSIGNPTFGTTGEGSAITAFDTTSFVSAFDTTIFPASAGMEIGLDFEEDSPTNVGAIILDKFGEKAQEWYDYVIAVGDGTTQPQGIANATGITSITSDFGTSGPATVSDYEGLMFGVNKAFRNSKGGRNVFLANEVTYRRARAIPVGPTDERRVFGMSHADYMMLDTPYKIQNSIANTVAMYANLAYYRLYRRLGISVRNETAGNYLATRNMRLVVVRIRAGGKMELGGAATICSDMQS